MTENNNEPVRIETETFSLELPPGWEISELDDGAELNGPNDEFLVVSSYDISSDAQATSLQSIKEEFEEDIVTSLKESANEPDLKITSQLKRQKTAKGHPVWSIKTEATDGSQFFDQYATIGKDTVVMISIDGDMQDIESSEIVFDAVTDIKWRG